VRHGSGGGGCMLGRKIRYVNVLCLSSIVLQVDVEDSWV